MYTTLLIIGCTYCLICSCSVAAAVPPALLVNSTYVQDFSSLQSSDSTNIPFVQGVTIPSWWSNKDSYISSNGSLNWGGLYCFHRDNALGLSLGAITSLKTKEVIFGASFTTTKSVSRVLVSFSDEQFRYGGQHPDSSQLRLDFSVMSLSQYENGGWGALGADVGWIPVPALSFSSLLNESLANSTAGPVYSKGGILYANLTASIEAAQILQIRWTAQKASDALAISNFKMTFGFAEVTPDNEVGQQPRSVPWRTVALAGWGFGLVSIVVIGILGFTLRSWKKKNFSSGPATSLLSNPSINDIGVYGMYASLSQETGHGRNIVVDMPEVQNHLPGHECNCSACILPKQ